MHDVLAAEGLHGQPVEGGVGAHDVHVGGETDHRDLARVAEDLPGVAPGGAVHHDHCGRGEIVHRDDVVPGACDEVDRLESAEVHRHDGNVPGEPRASSADRRDVDRLGDVGAVEKQRVEADLTVERVVVVARVPGERVEIGKAAGRERG